MSEQVETRLTPRERLTRGLAYSAVGPVDVTRGLLRTRGRTWASVRPVDRGRASPPLPGRPIGPRGHCRPRDARSRADRCPGRGGQPTAGPTGRPDPTSQQTPPLDLRGDRGGHPRRRCRRLQHRPALVATGAVAPTTERRGATAPLRPVVTRWGLGIRTPDPRLAQANHDADQWVTTQSTCERTQLRLTVVICNCGQSPKNRASIVACWSLT